METRLTSSASNAAVAAIRSDAISASTATPSVSNFGPTSAFLVKYGLSCGAAMVAETVTYPLDLTKTRLQISTKQTRIRGGGLVRTTLNIAKSEGIMSLWQGLVPAIYRHYVYTGVRVGLYELLRNSGRDFKDVKQAPLWHALVAGLVSGAVGQFCASPMDLVKVQFQVEGLRRSQNLPPRYTSTLDALMSLYRANGVRGLWTGWIPNTRRAALLNMADLATYDRTKHFLIDNTRLVDNWITHACASACSGFAAASVSTPTDVVKTRIMHQIQHQHETGGKAKQIYNGSIDCLRQIIRNEGFASLYRGFIPTYIRMAPWSLTFWLSYEHIRNITGAPSF